ncbi:MAG: hypothetical protein R6W66_00675 [Pelovirga sp.]
MALDELKKAEQVHTVNEIDLMIEAAVLPFTRESRIDYVNNEYGEGFSIATGRPC